MGGGCSVQCRTPIASVEARAVAHQIAARATRDIGEQRSVRSGGGGGVFWEPKVCVQKIAPPDFLSCKFRFSPRWSLWSWGGGGVLLRLSAVVMVA